MAMLAVGVACSSRVAYAAVVRTIVGNHLRLQPPSSSGDTTEKN